MVDEPTTVQAPVDSGADESEAALKYAGVGLRAVAIIVDTVILLAIAYLIAIFTGETTSGGFNLTGGSAFFWFLIGIAYFVVLEKSGGTIGKRLVGLRIVREDGRPLTYGDAIVRNVLRLVDGIFFYLVGAILVWTSPKKQRLGDRVAKTVVVRK